MKPLLSFYSLKYPGTIVYMLQSTEYQPAAYLKWFWRTTDFSSVAKRRQLQKTRPALALMGIMYGGMVLTALAAVVFVFSWSQGLPGGIYFAAATLLTYPLLWAHLIIVPLLLGRWFIAGPKEGRLIADSRKIFAAFNGTKIAVAGSYGKTSMKELLLTVLSEGLEVRATPGNKNVAVSHAYFARRLSGQEDVIIIEFGEGKPGDVARFSQTVLPSLAIITGIAPAHLDQYKSTDAAAQDIFSIGDYVDADRIYVNKESSLASNYILPGHNTYDTKTVMGWKISGIEVGYYGTSFVMKKKKRTLTLHSGLIGRHQVGPLALVAALADMLGLSEQQITEGIAKTAAYEHRMQPRNINGAWVIDDSYNGNLEGIKAGIELLKTLPAKRKLYVTPGLVDQGEQSKQVHHEIGSLLADAGFDKIILIQNSVTNAIREGLNANGEYKGEVVIEREPLAFYTHLDQMLANGDTVLIQNDWTDNYA